MEDTYQTIKEASEKTLFKDKGSKFYGYCFPVQSEEQVTGFLQGLKKEHPKARHWCYAWKMGTGEDYFKVNDDGEPSGSAGFPIYGQIQSKSLTNVLIVVVRYFGGTKLGVSGLINAYKTSAKITLEHGRIVTKTIDNFFSLTFSYKDMDKVLRVFKQFEVKIISQKMEITCCYHISIRQKQSDALISTLENLRCVQILTIN